MFHQVRVMVFSYTFGHGLYLNIGINYLATGVWYAGFVVKKKMDS